jgi:hypothetical protein
MFVKYCRLVSVCLRWLSTLMHFQIELLRPSSTWLLCSNGAFRDA